MLLKLTSKDLPVHKFLDPVKIFFLEFRPTYCEKRILLFLMFKFAKLPDNNTAEETLPNTEQTHFERSFFLYISNFF